MNKQADFVLDRHFDAPCSLVWRAWTDPDLVQRWYGPNVETVIHKFDLRPGGFWLNEMRWGEKSNYSKAVFEQVIPQERLVWIDGMTDSGWNRITNPMMENWPQEVLTTVTFASGNKGTDVQLSWQAHKANEAELHCFAEMAPRMGQGWQAGYAIIDTILAELSSTQD